jgi:hypothetical protein
MFGTIIGHYKNPLPAQGIISRQRSGYFYRHGYFPFITVRVSSIFIVSIADTIEQKLPLVYVYIRATVFTLDRINQPKGAPRTAETLVESTETAARHLHYHVNRNSTKYFVMEALGIY